MCLIHQCNPSSYLSVSVCLLLAPSLLALVVCSVTDEQGPTDQYYQGWFSTGTLVAPMPDSRGHGVWLEVSGEPGFIQMERVDVVTYLF